MQPPEDAGLSPYAGLSSKIRAGKSAVAVEYENRPPALSVSRPRLDRLAIGVGVIRRILLDIASSFRFAVDAHAFVVELDGEPMGELSSGETLELEVAAGEHRLRIKTPLAKSLTKSFQIENGQRFKYSCLATVTGISLIRGDS